ncbi:MAG: hypothetical protein ACRDP1_16605 [Nocardioidaceae bacterium]
MTKPRRPKGIARLGSTTFEWPVPDRSIRLAGRQVPLDVAAVGVVYLLSGLWLLWAFRDAVRGLPDLVSALFQDNVFAFAIARILLLLILFVLYIVLALLAVAYLVLRTDPVGRGLSVVVVATLLAVIASIENQTPVSVIVIMFVSAACCAVLFMSPWASRAFRASPRRFGRPAPVVVSHTLLVSYFALVSLIVVMMLPGLRFLGDLGARFVLFLLLAAASCAAAWWAYLDLRRGPDKRARILLTAACAVMYLALLIGASGSGRAIPLVVLAGIVAPLWLAPHARAWFGDPPL